MELIIATRIKVLADELAILMEKAPHLTGYHSNVEGMSALSRLISDIQEVAHSADRITKEY